MLPVLNFYEICLRSRGCIWQVFIIIWYLDKDENIFIFEIEILFFLLISDIKMRNFVITSTENVNYNIFKRFCGTNIMSVMFWSQSS